jgi:tetratricopeptide (TPR) repeat protein
VIKRVRAEEDNFRVMLGHLLELGDAERALRVAGGALSEYWTVSGGQFTEARTWLERALREGKDASSSARAWALYGLTILAVHQRDLETGIRAATEGLVLARESHDPLLAAMSPFALSIVEASVGRMDVAEALAVEAIDAARAIQDQDPGALAWPLQNLGFHRLQTGDLDGATSSLEEALALFRGCGGVWGECDTLGILAALARARGDLAAAARLHADSLRLRRDAGLLADVYIDLVGITELAHDMGHAEAAARLLGAEDAYSTRFGYVGIGILPMVREKMRHALTEQLGNERFTEAWAAGSALSAEQAVDEALALADELSIDHA